MIRAYDEYGNIIEDYEKSIYNKAIDDFVKRIGEEMPCDICDGAEALFYVDEIAEQLKAGDNND